MILLSPLSSIAADGLRGPALHILLPMTAILVVFGILSGKFILHVIEESRARAELIDRLEESQAEVARLSREAGTAAERERLAREIHDTLAQGFTSIVTLTEAIESELDTDPAAARRHVELAARTARENLAEARTMVAALAPADLASGSLVDAVRRQAGRLADETGVSVEYEVDGALPAIGMAGEVVLLRGAQEALNNVRRHAAASSVSVRLSLVDDAVRLFVRDDGVGFDPDGVSGFGLARHAVPGRAGGWHTERPERPERHRTHPGGAGLIRIMLVDDHPVVREGLRGMLEAEPDLTVVGEAGSGDEAVALDRVALPDVVLMDLRMPGLDGVGATKRILREQPGRRIVVLTTYETDADILRAVEAGASGYLLKDASRTELANAIRAASRGETVLAPSVAGKLVNRVRNPEPQSLSAREVEVLRLVAKGGTNADIGRALHISEATVKTHLLRVFGKLGVSDRTAAVTTAMARNLLG